MTEPIRTDDSRASDCSACSSLPRTLVVNTGRDEIVPVDARRLMPLGLDDGHDLRRCPECGALFEWEDFPQFYGSGNNAEERWTRLDAAQASVVEELLDPGSGARTSEVLYVEALRTLSAGILGELLRRMARKHPQSFAGFLEPMVTRLPPRSDSYACSVLLSYCDRHRDRLVELLRLLEAAGAEASESVRYLRRTCVVRIAELDSRTPTGEPAATTKRTSRQVAVELYLCLVTACPSYADRRASPPAEPPYDMTDFMHVCWDFAAHAVDMLQAGRQEELAPVFRAMAEFRDRSTEHWMQGGLAPVFERIWDEGKWRGVDVRAFERVIGPAFLSQWRHIEDPYDGHPYPIDGFY